ncbi:hypothetical protein TanjilG_15997 [Lupinus angustifolius]|uniref:Uncharacterized protein n=1 Tax=Lupinus angustifolius TaxID=3871 RepID=A0A4P1RH43_LUPAN|nr:hypothetical protein TanjilG_15997 [Lupinus angustifolius]
MVPIAVSFGILNSKAACSINVIYGCYSCYHMHQLCLIRWSHYSNVGQASYFCNIKCPMICWSISTNQTSSDDKSDSSPDHIHVAGNVKICNRKG